MPISARQVNLFTLFKLPASYFTGIRVKHIDENSCITSVKHRWVNQNPFKSMFWAVQGMAAELSTGALVMSFIKEQDQPISMLVANNKANFTKKATGRINFKCDDGAAIRAAIKQTLETGEGVTCWMKSKGVNKEGIQVSEFDFEWTVRVKKAKV